MEVEFKNIQDKKIVFSILLELPVDIIKEHIWFKAYKSFETVDSYKFQPKYINFIIEHKKQLFLLEKNKKIFQKDKKKGGICIENKKMDKDFFWINSEKYNKDVKLKSEPYRPSYIVDFLDSKKFDINDCSFHFESIVDYVSRTNCEYKDFKDIWFNFSLSDFEEIKEYISNKKLGTYEAFINSNIRNNTDIKSFYDTLYNEKYGFNEFNKERKSLVLDTRILSKNINISLGDNGNKYVDLYKIFKFFSTSVDIFPFLAIRHNNQNKVKIDTGFLEKNLIKNWSWNLKSGFEVDESMEIISPKGLLIKVKSENDYIDFHILEDGRMYVKFTKPCDLNNFKKSLGYSNINKAIEFINTEIKESFINFPCSLEIDCFFSNNMNIQVDIKYHMILDDFKKISSRNELLSKLYFSEFMEQTMTEKDSIGFVSKTKNVNQVKKTSYGKDVRFFDYDIYDDFTATIRRNTKYNDGSLINIDNISSINKFQLFLHQMEYVWFIFSRTRQDISTDFTKKVNKNKVLKEVINNFDARDCQKIKQPIISKDKHPLEGSYDLIIKDNRFVCLNKDYPYPGYTIKGNPCCFKKDQRKNEKFKNMREKENNFDVKPSNMTHKENGVVYQIVLYGEKVHYISGKKLILVPANINEEILDDERKLKNKTYFLPPVPFHRVVSLPSDRIDNVIREDASGNFFCKEGMSLGFNSKGYPYCFNSKPPISIPTKTKVNLKNHVITTDKILPINRLGTIPSKLSFLFPKIDKYECFRVGVSQNNYSFLNAIEKATGKTNILRKIKGNLDYSVFISLENGDLAPMYDFKIKEYKKFLEDENTYKPYNSLWEIAEISINTNIIIIDSDNFTFLCHERPKSLKKGVKCIFILKTGTYYEPMVYTDNKGDIKIYSLTDIDIIYKAYNFLCKPEIRIPNNIKYQILDLQDKSKIKYFVLDTGLIYPVTEKMGPVLTENSIPIKSINKRNPTAQRMFLLAQKENLDIKEQIVENINGTSFAIGLLTRNNDVIPTRKSELVPNLKIAENFIYFPKAEKKFKSKGVIDERKSFIDSKYSFEKDYHNVKFNISMYIKEKKYYNKDPDYYLKKFLDRHENEFINKNKEYILGRLSYEIKRNPLIKEGKVNKKYKEEYNPENQIIITEASKLIEYIDNIGEQ